MNDRAVRPKEAENCFRATQLLERAMVMGMGACVASLIVCTFPFCGPAAEPSWSTPVVLSQIIEVNLTPPIEQNPTPPIEQNPSPPIEQNPSPPIESDPKPSIDENPSSPTEEQSTRPTAGAGKVLVTHQRGHWHSNVAEVTG
jgi:hypothetical protein